METSVESHDSHRLFLVGFGHNGLLAHRTLRGVLPMEALNAVNAVGSVDGEGDVIEHSVAHDAFEAMRVIRLARGPQNPLHDGLHTLATFLKDI